MERLADRDGHPVWLMVDRTGRLPSEILVSIAPTGDRPGRLVTRVADPGLPFAGSWTWDVASSANGSTVTITERGEIRHPAFRFLARFIFGYTATPESFLRALGTRFGETVVPTAKVG